MSPFLDCCAHFFQIMKNAQSFKTITSEQDKLLKWKNNFDVFLVFQVNFSDN